MARSNGLMDDLSDFFGVVIGPSVLGDVAVVGVEGGLLGCGFLINLRDFKSEALVLGIATCFDDEGREGPTVVTGVRIEIAGLERVSFGGLFPWFAAAASEVPVTRRFFWVGGLLVLSGIDGVVNAEVNSEDGGPWDTF